MTFWRKQILACNFFLKFSEFLLIVFLKYPSSSRCLSDNRHSTVFYFHSILFFFVHSLIMLFSHNVLRLLRELFPLKCRPFSQFSIASSILHFFNIQIVFNFSQFSSPSFPFFHNSELILPQNKIANTFALHSEIT